MNALILLFQDKMEEGFFVIVKKISLKMKRVFVAPKNAAVALLLMSVIPA